DMAGSRGAGLASRASRGGDSRPVEADENRLVADTGDPDVAVLDEAPVFRCVDPQPRGLRPQGALELIPNGSDLFAEPLPVGSRQLEGGGHTDRSCHIVGARAPAQFLPTAMEHRLQGGALPHDQHAYPLGTAQLVS